MITVGQVCRALRLDAEPSSGVCRNSFGYPAEPRELWLAGAHIWVRQDARVSGWVRGNWFARRFTGLGAWRIKRAFNKRYMEECR